MAYSRVPGNSPRSDLGGREASRGLTSGLDVVQERLERDNGLRALRATHDASVGGRGRRVLTSSRKNLSRYQVVIGVPR